eukprot:TRINITY_DN6472_c0_g1_i2.p1 TRINITY_DN6472_c0_g1~~TRINITY_DN6472_c0_g1_i2.p1  ORF type:complete len:404 (+),score=104.77 TRINITY_DN6472_c0_g1_i2:441-1652(+)
MEQKSVQSGLKQFMYDEKQITSEVQGEKSIEIALYYKEDISQEILSKSQSTSIPISNSKTIKTPSTQYLPTQSYKSALTSQIKQEPFRIGSLPSQQQHFPINMYSTENPSQLTTLLSSGIALPSPQSYRNPNTLGSLGQASFQSPPSPFLDRGDYATGSTPYGFSHPPQSSPLSTSTISGSGIAESYDSNQIIQQSPFLDAPISMMVTHMPVPSVGSLTGSGLSIPLSVSAQFQGGMNFGQTPPESFVMPQNGFQPTTSPDLLPFPLEDAPSRRIPRTSPNTSPPPAGLTMAMMLGTHNQPQQPQQQHNQTPMPTSSFSSSPSTASPASGGGIAMVQHQHQQHQQLQSQQPISTLSASDWAADDLSSFMDICNKASKKFTSGRHVTADQIKERFLRLPKTIDK